MLYRKEFECSSCGLRFEPVECNENTESRCPACGSTKVNILKVEEKKPTPPEDSSRYTCS